MNSEEVFENIQHSVIFYLQEIFARAYGYIEDKEKLFTSVRSGEEYDISNYIPLTDGSGKAVQNVSVFEGAVELPSSEYFLNYYDGTIRFNGSRNNIIVKYKERSIDIISAFPDLESENFDRQVISVEMEDIYSRPFEIGSHRRYWKTNYFIGAFCFNKMLRKSISSRLALLFSKGKIPLIDFKETHPINQDGSINEAFDMFEEPRLNMFDFGNVNLETLNLASQNKKDMYHSSVFGILTVIF